MWWHRGLAIALGLGIVCHMVSYYIDFQNYQQKMANIEVSNVDLSEIADGIYEGEYDAGYIYAKVAVEVKDGTIVSVDILEHRNERGKSAESSIPDAVIEQQKIAVDAVSSATNSSKVIMEAIENALTN